MQDSDDLVVFRPGKIEMKTDILRPSFSLGPFIKFGYSEKAIKFEKNLPFKI